MERLRGLFQQNRPQADINPNSLRKICVYTLAYELNLDRAIADFTEAIELDPKLIIAFRNRATAWFEKGDLDRALADHVAAMRADPTGSLTQKSRAAAEFVDKIRESPQSGDPYYQRGMKQAEKGDLDRAIADFTTAIKLEPKDPRLYEARADAAKQKGDFDRAIADYTEVIKLAAEINAQPNKDFGEYYPTSDLRLRRGFAWHAKGDLDHAIADYTEEIRVDSASTTRIIRGSSPFTHRGIAWSQKGDRARALADYAEAEKTDPTDIPRLGRRGYSAFYQGAFRLAAIYLLPTVDLNDHLQHMLFHYLALSRAGEKADAQLEANVARVKNREWAHAIVELYLGRRSADATLGSATNPDDRCEAQFHVGQWHLLRGRRADAKSALQIAADTCPKDFVEYSAAVGDLKRLAP